MIKCQYCQTAVARNGLSMFEHLITRHGADLLRDPVRLIRMTQDPATRGEITRALAQQLVDKAAGAFLTAGGKHAKKP